MASSTVQLSISELQLRLTRSSEYVGFCYIAWCKALTRKGRERAYDSYKDALETESIIQEALEEALK